MSSTWDFSRLLWMVVSNLPLIGVYAVGIIMALTNLRRYPRAARLVLAGFLVLSFDLVAGWVVNAVLVQYLVSNGWSSTELSMAFGVVGFMRSALHAIGLFLLVLAALGGHGRAD